MAKNEYTDYLNITSLLSDEEVLIRKTARSFVDDEVLPIINEHFEAATFPTDLIPQMAELGFLGAPYPEQYGGAGLGPVAYGLLNQELERGDSGIRSFVSVQTSLAMYPIFAFGSDDQKERWLPEMSRGKVIGCFGLTEPDVGSNPAAMRTTARKVDQGWVLSGSKMWITNGSIAQLAIVWAKDEEGTVRGFIVETDSAGFSAPLMHGKLSLRASVTSELVLNDVFVPDENLLPKVTGLRGPLRCLNQARYSIAWGVLGAAIACYEASLDYALEREQFGKPIAGFQLTQEKLVWMASEISKGQLLALQLGRLKENSLLKFQQVSMGKRENVAMARKCAALARELHGANGIMLEYPPMRHMLNLESVYTYEGTHEMHTLIIGEDITGLSAFK